MAEPVRHVDQTGSDSTVSVVIPTIGRPSLRRAVQSALGQTRPPHEVLVVFDGQARDHAARWRDRWPDAPVRIVVADGGGPTATRTAGVRAATGTLIGFLDDDDEWLPTKLAEQVTRHDALCAEIAYPVVIAQCVDVDEEGRVLFVPKPVTGVHPLGDRLFRRTSVRQRTALGGSSAILAPRELLLAEPLNPAINLHEDWEWLLRADRRADVRVTVVERPLLRYLLNRPGTSAGSPGKGWWESVAFGRSADLSPRALGDFLITVSAPIAAARGSRRDAWSIAALAVREGRPGLPAVSMFLLLMTTPARFRWAAAALLQRLRHRGDPGSQP
ncbi:glycosyltransferase family 2 protein [Micromonospora craniellae]|uniref:glycosyltransferase family 2 protein n=1 Tax=Micromonospora craniellae TaxID=2294034 RepID=UPI001314B583|nr:glycosyltransferase family 2 protein [Micromonospora craniellae]QOC90138.1 glycosyltransferase family 2 protein [Micromonospora craniellae]